jgi:hypothetical protein
MWEIDGYEGNGNVSGNSDGYEGGWDGTSAACEPRPRRMPVPGSEGWQYRYADTCANCDQAIVGEFTGVLACGEVISWRHKRGFTFGCSGRVDRAAMQAIPADEADSWCPVHRKVTRWHKCEQGEPLALVTIA